MKSEISGKINKIKLSLSQNILLLIGFVSTLIFFTSVTIAGSGIRGVILNSTGAPNAGVFVYALEVEQDNPCWKYYESKTTWSNGISYSD